MRHLSSANTCADLFLKPFRGLIQFFSSIGALILFYIKLAQSNFHNDEKDLNRTPSYNGRKQCSINNVCENPLILIYIVSYHQLNQVYSFCKRNINNFSCLFSILIPLYFQYPSKDIILNPMFAICIILL